MGDGNPNTESTGPLPPLGLFGQSTTEPITLLSSFGRHSVAISNVTESTDTVCILATSNLKCTFLIEA